MKLDTIKGRKYKKGCFFLSHKEASETAVKQFASGKWPMKTTVKQLQVVRVRADRTTALPKARKTFASFNPPENSANENHALNF